MRRIVWHVFKWALALGAVAVVAFVGLMWWVFSGARVSNVGELDFANELRIPELLEPTRDADGRAVFDLEAREGETQLLDGAVTPTLGYNGSHLGPTLRASRGDTVVVNVTNELAESTTVHWHGMHLPAVMDGGPHQPIDPGATWSPTWGIDQPAATLWYHPHPHQRTEAQVYRGLAGLFIVDDDHTDVLRLPNRYGVDDIPLVIQDKSFDGDGEFAAGGNHHDEILVNGTHDPRFEATSTLVRFRVLNASTARIYNLGFTDHRRFALIGTDGGLLEAPAQLERVPLSPGERAEIVVAFTPGDDVILRSFEPDLGTNFFSGRFEGGDDTFDLVHMTAGDEPTESPPLPDRLADIEPIDPDDAVETRTFRLSGTQINGRSMDMDRIDATVAVDTTEIWEVTNPSDTPHNFHIHDVQFQVLSTDGEAPGVELHGWQDTIYLRPNVEFRLAVRFTDYTDPNVGYMLHCHVLNHEDDGMMAQLVVTDDGEAPRDGIDHTDHDTHDS
ncbi:MAG: multicopper oxidase family protein [Acidimicrobiales bacterium]